jgi:rod shape-determining protein MreD
MNRSIFKYILHFIFIILIQALVLNNIYLFNLIHPYIYILFLLILPVNINRLVLLLISFGIGFILDIFSNIPGLHTSTMVFIGFLRPFVIKFIISEDVSEQNIEPHITTLGFRRYLIFALIMVFIHHSFIFFVQVLSIKEYIFTFYKIIINVFSTILIILIYEILFFYKKQEG